MDSYREGSFHQPTTQPYLYQNYLQGESLQNPYYLAEDLSMRYKALIDAERKSFLEAEGNYNAFIEKLDKLYRELEENYNRKIKEVEELRADVLYEKSQNKTLAKTVGQLYEDKEDKEATLRKLYFAHTELTKKFKGLEGEKEYVAQDITIKQDRLLNLDHEYRASLLQRNLLDERLSEAEAKFTAELSRLRKVVDDRDKYIVELEYKLEEFASENRRIYDQYNRLKLESESQKLNLDGKIHQQGLEIEHLRSVLDEERARVKALAALAESHKALAESKPSVVLSHPGQSESNFYQQEANRLRMELENAQHELRSTSRALEKFKSQKEHVVSAGVDDRQEDRYNRSSSQAERVVEKIVEKIVEKKVYMNPEEVRSELVRRMDRLMAMYQRSNARYLKPYLFFIWRMMIALQHLLMRYKQAKAQLASKSKDVEELHQEKFERENRPEPTNTEKILELYQFARSSIVELIFEVFVRSANHAYTKKINSLILFVVNVNELKERSGAVLDQNFEIYFRLKEIAEEHKPEDPALEQRFNLKAMSRGDKQKNIDIDFRDSINGWIEDTIEQIDKKKATEKKDEANMKHLYLFRLLAIKYRCQFPISSAPFVLDSDLQVKLEDKICTAFHGVLDLPLE